MGARETTTHSPVTDFEPVPNVLLQTPALIGFRLSKGPSKRTLLLHLTNASIPSLLARTTGKQMRGTASKHNASSLCPNSRPPSGRLVM